MYNPKPEKMSARQTEVRQLIDAQHCAHASPEHHPSPAPSTTARQLVIDLLDEEVVPRQATESEQEEIERWNAGEAEWNQEYVDGYPSPVWDPDEDNVSIRVRVKQVPLPDQVEQLEQLEIAVPMRGYIEQQEGVAELLDTTRYNSCNSWGNDVKSRDAVWVHATDAEAIDHMKMQDDRKGVLYMIDDDFDDGYVNDHEVVKVFGRPARLCEGSLRHGPEICDALKFQWKKKGDLNGWPMPVGRVTYKVKLDDWGFPVATDMVATEWF